MIRNYRDHAANERTWLAWVRTALAIMAFGFLIEKFDLLAAARAGVAPVPLAGWAGLVLMGVGGCVVVVATFRFLARRRQIDAEAEVPCGAQWSSALLALLLVGVACCLLVYVALRLMR